MIRWALLSVAVFFAVGCLGQDESNVAPPPAPREVAPSCGESNGLCRETCYGTCEGTCSAPDEQGNCGGNCDGTCNGACCT